MAREVLCTQEEKKRECEYHGTEDCQVCKWNRNKRKKTNYFIKSEGYSLPKGRNWFWGWLKR